MITGYLGQAAFWTSCLIDGLERTSGSFAGSKLLLLTRRTDRVRQVAATVYGIRLESIATAAQPQADRVA